MDTQQINQSDHDALTTLIANVSNNHAVVLEKLQDMNTRMKEMSSGTQVKIAEHDLRIRTLETLRDKLNPESIVLLVKTHEKWISDFQISWKTMLGIASLVGSAVTFLLTVAAFFLKIFK